MLALFLKSCSTPMHIELADISNGKVKSLSRISDVELTMGKSSTTFLKAIEKIFNEHSLSWEDITYIYMASGPGSYTGARVLITVVKTVTTLFQHLKVYDASILTIYQQMNQLANVNVSNYGIAFARRNKFYVKKDAENPIVLSTEELVGQLEFGDLVNGFIYRDAEDIALIAENLLDLMAWYEVAVVVEDIVLYEPIYIEGVTIG